MSKSILLDYDLPELEEYFVSLGFAKFRAVQVFGWLHKNADINRMTNLSKDMIVKLNEIALCNPVKIRDIFKSQKDGTRKYLFELLDGNLIEGVLMQYSYGNTLCISTQVGCRMGCAFCASGLEGLIRNLSAGEIAGQVIAVNSDLGSNDRNITNIVLMGSGEPLDNYDNVIKFLNIINNPKGLNVSKRNISLSTCGLCERIYDLANDAPGVTLTISLHAPNDILREQIMPINKKYKIDDIINAVKFYFSKTGRRIIFEYSMIKGLNDTEQCAKELAKLVRELPCHVNLINLNFVKEKNLKGSINNDIQKFLKILTDMGVSATLRRTMGSDIEGACGQLRRRVMQESLED